MRQPSLHVKDLRHRTPSPARSLAIPTLACLAFPCVSVYLEKIIADEGEPSRIIKRTPIKVIVQNAISSVAFLADGQRFVGGGKDGRIRCWHMEDGEEVEAQIETGGAASSIAVSRDGEWVVAGREGGRVFIWDAKGRKKVNAFTAQKDLIHLLDISPDGKKFVTTSNTSVSVFSLSGGQVKQIFGWRNCNVHTVRFSPDGQFIAIGANRS